MIRGGAREGRERENQEQIIGEHLHLEEEKN